MSEKDAADAIQDIYRFLYQHNLAFRELKVRRTAGRIVVTVKGWKPCDQYEALQSLADELGIILHV